MDMPNEVLKELKPINKPKPTTMRGKVYGLFDDSSSAYTVDFIIKSMYEKHRLILKRNLATSILNGMCRTGYLRRCAPATYELAESERV
jgi:hypothetical protein